MPEEARQIELEVVGDIPKLYKCSCCGNRLLLKAFSNDAYRYDKRHPTCKSCDGSLHKRYMRSPKGKFYISKKKAKQRGLSWDISKEQYGELIKNRCYYCDQSIENSYGTGLDRINNEVGYTLDNVLPCCAMCNRIRHVYLTVDEMKAVAVLLKTMRNKHYAK